MKRRRHSFKTPRSHTYESTFQWCQQKALSLHLNSPAYDQPVRLSGSPHTYMTRAKTLGEIQKSKTVSFNINGEEQLRSRIISTAPSTKRTSSNRILSRDLSRSSCEEKVLLMTQDSNAGSELQNTNDEHVQNSWTPRHGTKGISKSVDNLSTKINKGALASYNPRIILPEVKKKITISKAEQNETSSDLAGVVRDDASVVALSSPSSAECDDVGIVRHRKRLSSAELCEVLKSKGFGDPKCNRQCVGPELTLAREKSLPNIHLSTHDRYRLFNLSHMNKMKGLAKMDYELATSKANAFCEMQRNNQMRSASANWRKIHHRVADANFEDGDVRTNSSHGDERLTQETNADQADEHFFTRIKTWICDVESASKDAQHKLEAMQNHDRNSNI